MCKNCMVESYTIEYKTHQDYMIIQWYLSKLVPTRSMKI